MKKENEKKMSWYDVTLYQFLKMNDISKIEDDSERIIAIAELILGEDVINLPISEFNKKVKSLEFMKEPVPDVTVPKKIEVNGREYFVDSLLGNITTAQYIDYTNHAKVGDTVKMLSVFIIPTGHTYNDGYDMLQVFEDVGNIPVPIVLAISFFFERQFEVYMRIFQRYLTKTVQKTNLPKKVKKALKEVMKVSTDTVLSLMY